MIYMSLPPNIVWDQVLLAKFSFMSFLSLTVKIPHTVLRLNILVAKIILQRSSSGRGFFLESLIFYDLLKPLCDMCHLSFILSHLILRYFQGNGLLDLSFLYHRPFLYLVCLKIPNQFIHTKNYQILCFCYASTLISQDLVSTLRIL